MTLLAPRRRLARSGFGLADLLLLLAVVALAISVALPRIRADAFERRVGRTIEEVDAVRASAATYHRQHGAWPRGAPDGPLPPELTAGLPSGVTLERGRQPVVWNRWRRTESGTMRASGQRVEDSVSTNTPTVTSLGSITVLAADHSLLAALLEHYGSAASFVRDSSWTLMIPAVDATADKMPSDST